ncbi:MAG: DNA primase [Candidatus Roizmanbacteria bacterium]|nr:DNA primase [Candidatus Roizmanbacteria bacterium]
MENQIDEIKRKIDIVEFIGSFITLKKAGRNFKAVCPFHQEKSPSFVVSPDRGIWHCFGACGEGGDAIKFLMKWENITFIEALKELAKKTGVKLTLNKIGVEDKIWQKKERYLGMNQLAGEFFHYVFSKTDFGKKARDYLKTRLLNQSIIDKFELGYSPSSWDSLKLFLKKKKYEEEEMLENGLLVRSERGSYYDRFRGRLMFPLKDSRNNILGFSGRILEGNEKEAKYVNTPETPIYHKRECLFGINLAIEEIKKQKNVYIVEGELDMIMPYQHGYSNFVAIKGTALTNEQLKLLKRYTDKITLMMDADVAGIESIKRGIDEAEKFDFEIRVVTIDFAKDPDEALRKDPNKFKKLIAKPVPIYDFLIEAAQKKYPEESAFSKKKIGEEVIPMIEKITNPIVRTFYVKKLAGVLEISENTVENLISQSKRKKNQISLNKIKYSKPTEDSRELTINKYVLSVLFQSEDPSTIYKNVFEILKPEYFLHLSYEKISLLFFKEMEKDTKFDINEFGKKLPNELRPIFDEIFLFASTDHNLSNESLDRLVHEIKKYYFKREIKKILAEEETEDKKKQLKKLSENLKEVEKNLISL